MAWTNSPSSRLVTVGSTLITPMYGCGVAPGEVDRNIISIRASAIRGQLRFW